MVFSSGQCDLLKQFLISRPRVSLPDSFELLDQFLSLLQRPSQSVEADLRLNNCSFSCLHIA